MASQGGGSSCSGKGKGKGKGKVKDTDANYGKRKRGDGEEGAETLLEDDTFCSSCESSDSWPTIQCDTCKVRTHGWCVNLRREEFVNGDHAWFDKYACPDCVKKGKRSTRSSLSLGIVSTFRVEYSDLHGSEAALWSLVLTTSDSSIRTENMKWVCRTAITNVQKSVVGQLDGEHPHVKLLELIVGYLHYLMIPMGEDQMLALFDFHESLVLLFLKASSPLMRQWGWDQMDGLIALTHRHCWSPKAIRVEGAGSQEVDGIYRVLRPCGTLPSPRAAYYVSGKTLPLSTPTYFREGGGFLLSLMPTEAEKHLWYITSEVDQTGPGTCIKEYYCYQAPSPAENLLRPCGPDWGKAVNGVNPPPIVTLVPTEGYLWPNGEQIETLECKLATWMIKNQVSKALFEEPGWLKVVNGSNELLRFMARMEGVLTTDDVSLMWRSGVQVEPALGVSDAKRVLVSMVPDVQPELVVHLLGRLQDAVDGSSEWGSWDDALEFLAQLADNPGHRILRRFEGVRAAIAKLVWSLLSKPEALARASCKPGSTLLASVAYTSAKTTTEDQENLQKFVERCIGSWRDSSELSESVSTVRLVLDNFKPENFRQLAELFHHGIDEPNASANWQNVRVAEGDEMCPCCRSSNFLENEGTDMFGVVSWRCRCKPVPKAHLRCILSYLDTKNRRGRTPCPVCQADMSFGMDRESPSAYVKLSIHDPPEDSDDPSGGDDANQPDSIPSPTDDCWRDPTF